MEVSPIQLISGLVVIGLWFALPFLVVGRNRLRDAALDRIRSVGGRALHRVQTPDPEAETVDAEVVAAERYAHLVRDVDRLHDLVQHDAGMSATRQRANRMAYDRLRAQLAAEPVPSAALRVPSSATTTISRTAVEVIDYRP